MKNTMKILSSNALQRGVLLFAITNLTACSTLQSWFPDKEKDYQFTTELSPLVIPPDLVQKPTQKITHSVPSPVVAPVVAQSNKKAATKTEHKNAVPLNQPESISKAKNVTPVPESTISHDVENKPIEIPRNEIQISLTHEDEPKLKLNVSAERAWHIVDKALTRHNIETIKHDQATGQIYIQLTNNEPKAETESIFGDLSVFNPFKDAGQQYILQIQSEQEKTSVIVLDIELQKITNDLSHPILSTLFDAIKADLSK